MKYDRNCFVPLHITGNVKIHLEIYTYLHTKIRGCSDKKIDINSFTFVLESRNTDKY